MKPDNAIIRASLRSMYDLQKLRIQIGNRIVAAYREKLGIAPGEAEDAEGNEDAAKILEQLRAEHKLITDGVKRVTRKTKLDSKLLTSPAEVKLIEAYEQQLLAEKTHATLLEMELEKHSIWTGFLQGVRGCGPLMAAVIISEVDIHKCNSISALHAYCGLDVVLVENEQGETVGEGRSRKAHHLKPKEYVNRDGKIKQTRGITFNPFLKTKMVGVLGSSFIRLGGKYRDIYVNYKFRLENKPKWKERSKAHRHNAATRYMVKFFLADLWTKWRELEGLPVRGSYAEEKLGIVHSQDEYKEAA